jgi:hypothetical protein
VIPPLIEVKHSVLKYHRFLVSVNNLGGVMSDFPKNGLPEFLTSIREENGLTMRALSLALGCTDSYVSRVENGEIQEVGDSFLLGLIDMFDLDPDRVFAISGRIHPDVVRILIDNPGLCTKIRKCHKESLP